MSNYTKGFQRWWECFPAHKRKGKGAAFQSWQKHNCEAKAEELIKALQQQVDFDEHFQKFTPLPTTYINQGRYDDDIPKPRRAKAPTPKEPEGPFEECKFRAAVNRLAFNWLWRRGGIPKHRMDNFRDLVGVLAEDLKAEHEAGKDYSKTFPKKVQKNLEDLMADDTRRVDELETLVARY